MSSKSTNTTDAQKRTSYDELLLFDELLSAELNKNTTNDKNIIVDRANRTSKIITGNTQSAQVPDWSAPQQQETTVTIDEEKIMKPVEKESTRKSFDPQQLIERIRKTNHRTYVTSNYELLSCKSQSFLQRLAVLGEILT